MCLLCYIEPNATPDWTGLENACDNNPDGFGYSIHHGDRITVSHFMDSTLALESFYEARRKYPDTAAMFHARWATHGTEDLTNCHPFRVGGDDSTVIGHNGVLNVNIPKGDKRSDTRYFCEEILPLRSSTIWDKPKKVTRLRETIMGGSKFVVFTTNPIFRHKAYIIGEDLGHWDNGTWWSNDSYSYSWKTYKKWGKIEDLDTLADDEWTLGTGKGSEDLAAIGRKAIDRGRAIDVSDEDAFCPECLSWLTSEESLVYRYCSTCLACLDCEEPAGACLCYAAGNSTSDPVTETQDRLPSYVTAEWGD